MFELIAGLSGAVPVGGVFAGDAVDGGVDRGPADHGLSDGGVAFVGIPVPQQPSYDPQDPAFWTWEFDRYVSAAMTATLAGKHEAALDAADEARRAAVRLQTTIVGNARRAGTSWSTIGRSADLTKQAAWTRWKDVEDQPATLAVTPLALAR